MPTEYAMEPAEIMASIRYITVPYPTEAIRAAMSQQEGMTPLLLEVLEESIKNQTELADALERMAHIYAMFLLASFREPRAYPLIVEFFSAPGTVALEATGEEIIEALPQLLASVACGDPSLIQRLIETPSVNAFIRAAGLKALLTMVAVEELSRDWVIGYLKELYEGKLERTPWKVWHQWILCVSFLGANELKDALLAVATRQFSNSDVRVQQDLAPELFEEMTDEQIRSTLTRVGYTLITDPVEEMSWWDCFGPESDSELLALSLEKIRAQREAAAQARKKAKAKAKRKQADASRRKNRKKK